MASQISEQPSILIVAIGVTRKTAVQTTKILEGTPYKVVGVLDQTESPEAYQYSPHNLGTLLHTLHPRPQALVAGTAVFRLVPEIQATWNDYVKWSREHGGEKEKYQKMAFVPVCRNRPF